MTYAAPWVMLSLLGACAEEVSREAYIASAASRTCVRLDECGRVGEGLAYLTSEECLRSTRPLFASLWPDDRCSGPQIDEERFAVCARWLDVFPCDSNLFESPALDDVCGADRVCTRAPDSGLQTR